MQSALDLVSIPSGGQEPGTTDREPTEHTPEKRYTQFLFFWHFLLPHFCCYDELRLPWKLGPSTRGLEMDSQSPVQRWGILELNKKKWLKFGPPGSDSCG